MVQGFRLFQVVRRRSLPQDIPAPRPSSRGSAALMALAQIQNNRSLRRKFPNAPTFASENVKRYWFSLRTVASANRRYSTFTPQQSQLYASSAEPYCSWFRRTSNPKLTAPLNPRLFELPYPSTERN